MRLCKTSISLRAGTDFESTGVSLEKCMILIYWWVGQYRVTQAASECDVFNGVAVDTYLWLQELCGWCLLNHDDLMLDGSGSVHPNVLIDESCFFHKPKLH